MGEPTADKVLRPDAFALLGLCAVLIVAGFLMFWGLDDAYPWGDEADTIFTARNILRSGVPTAWDGTNLFSWRDGAVLDERLWQTAPWLQYYVAAAFLRAFGNSVFVARLPFVLASLAGLAILYAFLLRLTRNAKLAILSVAILALNPSFLLFGKQARYYGLATLFTALLLYGWQSLEPRRPRSWIPFALGTVLFFHSNYFTFGAFFLALFVVTLTVERDWAKGKAMLFCSICSVPFILPFLLYVRPQSTPYGYALASVRRGGVLELLMWHVRDYSALGIFPILLVIPLGLAILRPSGGSDGCRRCLGFVGALVLAFTLVLCIISGQRVEATSYSDMRYALPALPLFAILTAAIVCWLYRRAKLLAGILLVLVAFTDLLTLAQFTPEYESRRKNFSPFVSLAFRPHLAEYVYEITHDYVSGYEAAIQYLDGKVREGDLLLAYDPYSLMVYFGSRLRFAGQLTEQNQRLLGPNRERLPTYVYSSRVVPDWIVCYGQQPISRGIAAFLEAEGISYETISLDTYGVESSRPELYAHTFKQIKEFPVSQAVHILRRADSSQPGGEPAGLGLRRPRDLALGDDRADVAVER